MRTFRRRSARRKEPVFWTRNAFTNAVVVDTAMNGLTIDNSTIQNVDQLATGGVTFTGIDERYTVRRIKMSVNGINSATSNGGGNVIGTWSVIVKTSTSALAALIGEKLSSVLSGGSTKIPSAMDVLWEGQWLYSTLAGQFGFTTGLLFYEPRDFDIKVSRRLEADESIAMLSGGWSFATFAAAASSTVRYNYLVSALYSRTMKR